MEEVCTCIICKNQAWIIYRDRMECLKCKKTYKWPLGCTDGEATKAQGLLNLTNDNY